MEMLSSIVCCPRIRHYCMQQEDLSGRASKLCLANERTVYCSVNGASSINQSLVRP